ncbi:Pantothenate synthetase [Wickerhamomyces ciferrii]|uniref:Pantoate--beta-alanine ligase n=1 Tax=Wickerhamomyces ciferrii (strain ATCC 14091 / BCRC 22168 / CBS 111 / JCM 3599 / NBRC 0793 / NRRL Y-1031 F-60-10) TaxID=1206466 RepID=K0KDS5_WICCF|nr:Pantothenate synthetase [Wickerhamomyces ciferrii]CCH43255.1 Pantothenate synthetase [Wickerhamomyces ciferrii]
MTDIKIIRTVKELRSWKSTTSGSIGFVPTMGALHKGHLSLDNPYTVVSIFVNPSQFAPGEDLDSYPRTFDQDYSILSNLKIQNKTVSVIFAPTISEMYPSGIDLDLTKQKGAFVTVLGVSEQLEGKTRPNFFRGVSTVVLKLFNAVQPQFAYFGQKDIQQTVVLKRMVKDLLLPLEIIVMPIVREDSGLALSSRNSYLSESLRSRSSIIYENLQECEKIYQESHNELTKDEIVSRFIDLINNEPDFQIDYISLANLETLEELSTIKPGQSAVLSTAVYVTENNRTIRLLDNIILN